MVDDDDSGCECPPSMPAWLATFADLMSLLMCFFVLLLSFSEMDAMKFKRLAGSMAQAFGVQSEQQATDIPKGTSIIAQEFSPGRPDPTPINEIWQKTSDFTEMSLETRTGEMFDLAERDGEAEADATAEQVAALAASLRASTRADGDSLAAALEPAIAGGQVDVEVIGRRIVVRIRERGTFASGSADLTSASQSLLEDLRIMLQEIPGRIHIEGHTDNQPISTARFRSNWELSAARAVSVAHALLGGGTLDAKRFEVTGRADTAPLAANATAADRALNRRVEIWVEQGLEGQHSPADQALIEGDAGDDLRRELDLAPDYPFQLRPDEVF